MLGIIVDSEQLGLKVGLEMLGTLDVGNFDSRDIVGSIVGTPVGNPVGRELGITVGNRLGTELGFETIGARDEGRILLGLDEGNDILGITVEGSQLRGHELDLETLGTSDG